MNLAMGWGLCLEQESAVSEDHFRMQRVGKLLLNFEALFRAEGVCNEYGDIDVAVEGGGTIACEPNR